MQDFQHSEFVENNGGKIRQLRPTVAQGVTHRVLHPAVGGKNPDGRQAAAAGHQPHHHRVGFF